MHSKDIFISVITIFLISCSPKSQPRHQQALSEQNVEIETQIESIPVNELSENDLEIYNLIKKENTKSYLEALRRIQPEILGPKSNDPQVYTTRAFTYKLTLYVELFLRWTKSPEGDFKNEYKRSLEQFKTGYFRDCLFGGRGSCTKVKDALKSEKAVVALLIYFSNQEKEKILKLKWITIAFDIVGKTKETSLERAYIRVLKNMQNQPGGLESTLSPKEAKRHTRNYINILNGIRWSEVTDLKADQILSIAPWSMSSEKKDEFFKLKESVIPYLPEYYKKNQEIRNQIDSYLKENIESLMRKFFEIKKLPAYESIQVEKLKNEDPMALFIVLKISQGEIDLKAANLFTKKISNKKDFIESAFRTTKLLTRLRVAVLGTQSTDHLASFFKKEKIKTKSFFQETLQEGEKLYPIWSDFYNNEVSRLKKFLIQNQNLSTAVNVKKIEKFFGSIKRNVLKTIVYPNMLALTHSLAKAEWVFLLRVLWFEFKIDSNSLYQNLFAGMYKNPWFNFTNFANQGVVHDANQESLYGTEMLDSIYYFFATGVHKKYGIDADDFLNTMGSKMLRNHEEVMELTLQKQKKIYFSEGTPFQSFLKWCEGLKAGNPQKESIHFYQLFERILPLRNSLDGNLTAKAALFNENLSGSFLYDDRYEQKPNLALGEKNPRTFFLKNTNDAFRTEFLQIFEYFKQSVALTKRLSSNKPTFGLGSLKKTNQKLEQLENLQKAFLGAQVTIHKNMKTCLYDAHEEARRRAVQVKKYEKLYLMNVIYPLLKEVMAGNKDIEEANQEVGGFHSTAKGNQDKIVRAGEQLIYSYTKQSFFLRVRDYLRKGSLNPKNNGLMSPHANLITHPAIVGTHLEISVPPNMNKDPGNVYQEIASDRRPVVYEIYVDKETSAENFSKSGLRLATDKFESSSVVEKYSRWDQQDMAFFREYFRYRLEFMVQLLYFNGMKYLDFNKEACRKNEVIRSGDCHKKINMSLKEVAEDMSALFKTIELDEERLSYLEDINETSFADKDILDVLLKTDTSMPKPSGFLNHLPFKKISGFFDFAYRLVQANYIGEVYERPIDIFSKVDGDEAKYPCSTVDDDLACLWKAPKGTSLHYYYARSQRPGFIFQFDQQILEDSYNFVRSKIDRKFNLMKEMAS